MKSPTRKRRFVVDGLAVTAILLALGGLVLVIALVWGGSQERFVPGTKRGPKPPVISAMRLFAADSIWNTPVPASATPDPSSARLVSALSHEASAELGTGVGPWIATGKASTPIYEVGARQPTVQVQLDTPTLWWRVGLARAFRAVPVPPNAQPAPGPDAHMTVWQPSTGQLWEFFHMRHENDGWHAAWGGAIQNVSSSPGYYTTASWPGALPQWGATATSLPVAAGVITASDIHAGRIDHALALDLPAPRAGVFAWPAQRSDGTGGADTIPEGAQLRLDPRLNLATLSLPPFTRMMAEAAQRYGIIVRDQTHEGLSFFAQDVAGTTSAGHFYYGPNGVFGGQTPQQLLQRFPWSHLEVLKMHLCSRAPCQRQ